jgi:hypothetical protein
MKFERLSYHFLNSHPLNFSIHSSRRYQGRKMNIRERTLQSYGELNAHFPQIRGGPQIFLIQLFCGMSGLARQTKSVCGNHFDTWRGFLRKGDGFGRKIFGAGKLFFQSSRSSLGAGGMGKEKGESRQRPGVRWASSAFERPLGLRKAPETLSLAVYLAANTQTSQVPPTSEFRLQCSTIYGWRTKSRPCQARSSPLEQHLASEPFGSCQGWHDVVAIADDGVGSYAQVRLAQDAAESGGAL